MSLSQEYIDAGYIVENPDNDAEIIWAPKMRVLKSVIDAGGFEMIASKLNYQTEVDPVTEQPLPIPPAPVVCEDGVKKYARFMLAEALRDKNHADADALTLAQLNAMV